MKDELFKELFTGKLIKGKDEVINMIIGQTKKGFLLQPLGLEKEFVNH